MANVAITGGAGFLGARVARELLAAGSIEVAGSGPQPLSEVTLIDQWPRRSGRPRAGHRRPR